MSNPYQPSWHEPKPEPQYPHQPPPSFPIAAVSLVCGIISLLPTMVGFCCIPFVVVGMALSLIGIVTGIFGYKSPHDRGLAIAGIITSGFAMLICLAWVVFHIVVIVTHANISRL